MKLNKFFMLGMAGLAFAACSNEEDAIVDNNVLDGNGVVSVTIVSPETLTKAMPTELPNATQASSVKVTGDITVRLTAGSGNLEATLTKAQIAAGTSTVKFWNVSNPTKVEAFMNNAPEDGDYSDVQILDLQVAPADIPAYGSATPQLTANAEKPDLDAGNVVNDNATADDENKTYQMYEATINMKIPVARLEVSGIQHIVTGTHVKADCEYQTLTIDGVYLDNIKATGGGTFDDYQFNANGAGTGEGAILKYTIASPDNNFMTADQVWPVNGKAYSFNFFPGDKAEENPVFKIYFEKAVAAEGQDPKSEPRYAMITKYVSADTQDDQIENAAALTLEAGKIYRITSAVLDDKNIIGDEGGNTLYGVTVKVVEATWGGETIKAEWAE